MNALRVGQKVDNIPNLPGTWSVWSAAGGGWPPGSYFVLPPSGGGHAVIRAIQKQTDPHPTLELLHREAPK